MPFLNRIRIPFHLSRPQYPAEEDVYLKGNGRRVVMKAIVSKVMDGKTDWMPSPLHERLSIALRHDIVTVEGEKYTGEVKLVGAYDIDWSDFLDYPFAPASFKAFEEAFVARSNRCDICEETNFLSLVDDQLGVLEEGETYNINVTENDSICCGTPVLSIFSYDTDYIDSISISQAGVVSLTLKTPLASVPDKSLFTYKVVCGELEETADVTATIEGSLTALCEAPSNLILSIVDPSSFPVEIRAEWDEPSGGAPADGYGWLLLKWPGGVPVGSGTTTDTFLNINALDCDQDYRFYVRAICDLATEYWSGYIHSNIESICGLENMVVQVEAIEDPHGLFSDWFPRATIISPLGITLDEDLEITGTMHIFDTPDADYAFSVTIPAGMSTADGADVGSATFPSTATIDPSMLPVPATATGSDLLEYQIFLTP